MSIQRSIRHFKELVGRLEREPTKEDIELFGKLARSIVANLRGVFFIGRPIPPEKRVRRARGLLKLAAVALGLWEHEPAATVFAKSLQDLDEAVEEAEERLSQFLAKNLPKKSTLRRRIRYDV